MAELIDTVELSPSQYVDLYANREVWIHDNSTFQDIQLEAGPATKLFDFLLLHQERVRPTEMSKLSRRAPRSARPRGGIDRAEF